MDAPDLTYRFQGHRDTAGPTFEILSRTLDTGAVTLASPSLTITGIPQDRILVLTNVVVEAIPGAAQNIIQFGAQITTPAGATLNIALKDSAVAAPLADSLSWQGAVYVQGSGVGNNTVRFFAVFNAGVAGNRLIASACGTVIPRGNAAAF